MNYYGYIENAYPIGSEAVEAACKVFIGTSAKQSGMRWKEEG